MLTFSGIKTIVLTISDSCSKGERKDKTGEALLRLLQDRGAELLERIVVPDEVKQIIEKLELFCDQRHADLVLSCGGTGLGPRDVTPEATRIIIDKEIPGIVELVRSEGIKKTKNAALSRAVAGIRGNTLIINLPGSPRGARESFEAIADIIPHALAMLRGEGHS